MIVTGASSGIGVLAARDFAREGADLALLARSRSGLEEAATRVRDEGRTAHVVPVDLTDREAAEHAVARSIVALGGELDVLVVNHAASAYGPFRAMSPEDFDRSVRATFNSAVDTIRAALPALEQNAGTIVVTVSIVSRTGIPHQSPYSAAKHALRGFLDALRRELRAEHSSVRVCMVHPGPIDTPFWRHVTSAVGVQSRAFKPTYAPDIVSAALVEAAVTRRPEVTVGGSGLATNVLSAVARPVADLALSTYGIVAQRGTEPADEPGAVYEASGRGEPTGGFSGRGSFQAAFRLLRSDLLPLPGLRRR